MSIKKSMNPIFTLNNKHYVPLTLSIKKGKKVGLRGIRVLNLRVGLRLAQTVKSKVPRNLYLTMGNL